LHLEHGGADYRITFNREDVRFPFRPVGPHLFGLDDSGRDVLARIFYGLRTSLNFGLLLVMASMVVGTIIGSIQGYYGGRVDLTGQRLTEIWEALPFLYVLILLGSVYGRSFVLLLVVYGLFNWIGISYYMRAEFLRLRNQQFVEAAQCLGLPDRKILFRHILPNALVPLTTFFPFSLVGAIGTLAALDYLGFGLPPPTASWGQLLAQAQGQAYWWLILYPSLALFLVILLCVFIGEGVRNAFDPRKFTRLE
jgi:microcin C transport system permease protein